MSTYKVEVTLSDGRLEVVFVKSAKSMSELAMDIAKNLREYKVATIKHSEGVLIAVSPISVSVV